MTLWSSETEALRRIALDCGLTEEKKWGKPCFTLAGRNVALIQGFKEYCALLFFDGALLTDLLPDGEQPLHRVGEHTRAGRQLRFAGLSEISKQESTIRHFLQQATALAKAGKRVDLSQSEPPPIPAEWQQALEQNPALQSAFLDLTPGRQRAYLLHFAAPKQAKTRLSRIEKCTPQILAGKGLND